MKLFSKAPNNNEKIESLKLDYQAKIVVSPGGKKVIGVKIGEKEYALLKVMEAEKASKYIKKIKNTKMAGGESIEGKIGTPYSIESSLSSGQPSLSPYISDLYSQIAGVYVPMEYIDQLGVGQA